MALFVLFCALISKLRRLWQWPTSQSVTNTAKTAKHVFFRGTISVHSGADMWCYNMCLAQTFSTTVLVFSICENWVTLSMWAYFGVCWGSVSKLSLRACWNQFIEPVRNGIIVVIQWDFNGYITFLQWLLYNWILAKLSGGLFNDFPIHPWNMTMVTDGACQKEHQRSIKGGSASAQETSQLPKGRST